MTAVLDLVDGASAPPNPDAVGPLRAALRGVATVVAPTTIATSLFFYFGWARTSTQAQVMGLHDSLLGYSAQDYILRSIDPMFWPLFVGVLTGLAALPAHVRIVTWAGPAAGAGRRRLVGGLALALGSVGALSLGLGALGVRIQHPTRLVSLASPLCVTAGIVLAGYALHLRGRFLATRPAAPPPEAGQLRLVASSLMVLLVLLGVFWSVARYAQIKGIDLALQLEKNRAGLADVSIYSAKRLNLQAPVVETDLGADGSAYRYRYTGLKLLFRAQHRYFLQPADESGAGVNIVIAEGDSLRFEFSRPGA